MVTSLVFSITLVVLLGAGLARGTHVALGFLAWLVLLGSGIFVTQASAQYSDLLLGLAFLAALVLLDRADRANSMPVKSPQRLLIAAGLAAGFAPWIKNEGWPFAIVALGLAAWRFRSRGVVWLLLGAVPGLAATVVLKLVARGREAILPATAGEALHKLADPSRWWQALAGFADAAWQAGPFWAHPVVLVAALAVVLRFVPAAERRARVWLWIPIAVTLAAEYGLYLVTTADLTWHISTSVNRLLAQVWPSLIWLVFLGLRAPEEYFLPTEAPSQKGRPEKLKKKRAQA